MNKKTVSFALSAVIMAACCAGCGEQEIKDNKDVFNQLVITSSEGNDKDSSQAGNSSVTTSEQDWEEKLISTPRVTTTTTTTAAQTTTTSATKAPATTSSAAKTKPTQTTKIVTKQTQPPKPSGGTSPNLAFYKQKLFVIHRIPAWYCDDCGHITVSTEDVCQCEKCQSFAYTYINGHERLGDILFKLCTELQKLFDPAQISLPECGHTCGCNNSHSSGK